jgi:hypothetical protein
MSHQCNAFATAQLSCIIASVLGCFMAQPLKDSEFPPEKSI